MKRIATLIGLAVIAGIVGTAPAAVIQGVTGFELSNDPSIGWDWSSWLFDSQPTSDPVQGEITSTPVGGQSYLRGYVGIDFDSDFSTKTFTHVYMLQRSWAVTDVVMDYYWSDDQALDIGVDVAAPDINLFNYPTYNFDDLGRWELEYENLAGVTPQAQYLIGVPQSGSGGSTQGWEVAFVNIPEPVTMSLVGLGGLMLVRRRRRI